MRTAEIKGNKPSDVLVNRYRQAICSFVDRDPVPVLPVCMLSEDITPISPLTQGAGTVCHVASIYAMSRMTRNTPPQVDTPTCKNISRAELLFYCCAVSSVEVDAAYIVNAFAPDIFAQESDSWYCKRDLAIENIQTYRCLDDIYSGHTLYRARKTSVTFVADGEQKKKEEDPRKKTEKQKPDKKDNRGSRRVKRPKV